jgi:hypothetical protein
MTELVMMQAALFNLSAAIDGIEDSFIQSQIRLASRVLAGTIEKAATGITPAVVSDIEFALNDLAGAADELSAADAERILPFIAQLRGDVMMLTAAAALPEPLISAIQELQTKLKARRKAIERQTFVEGGAEPLPHPPAELRAEALPIREQLAAAGFATPALDALIDDPESLRMHGIIAIVDELEVISGT